MQLQIAGFHSEAVPRSRELYSLDLDLFYYLLFKLLREQTLLTELALPLHKQFPFTSYETGTTLCSFWKDIVNLRFFRLVSTVNKSTSATWEYLKLYKGKYENKTARNVKFIITSAQQAYECLQIYIYMLTKCSYQYSSDLLIPGKKCSKVVFSFCQLQQKDFPL